LKGLAGTKQLGCQGQCLHEFELEQGAPPPPGQMIRRECGNPHCECGNRAEPTTATVEKVKNRVPSPSAEYIGRCGGQNSHDPPSGVPRERSNFPLSAPWSRGDPDHWEPAYPMSNSKGSGSGMLIPGPKIRDFHER